MVTALAVAKLKCTELCRCVECKNVNSTKCDVDDNKEQIREDDEDEYLLTNLIIELHT